MANKTHASLAENAAAYIGRSSDALQGFGSDPNEIERQAICLIKWAWKNDAVLSGDYTSNLERQEGTTAEHEVFYRASDNRAVKRTHAGTFGVTEWKQGGQAHATPPCFICADFI
jgi:hypothetical protein